MSQKMLVRRAAVLGAGVMGAQIAAHLTNAGVDTVLFDLPAKDGDPNGVVQKAIANLAKLSPAPLAGKGLAEAITPANYETGLEQLKTCDLIIEAIAERMDWKQDLYRVDCTVRAGAYRIGLQHLGPWHQCAGVGVAGRIAASVLRRAFLQSAALYASGRTDPGQHHRTRPCCKGWKPSSPPRWASLDVKNFSSFQSL